MDLQRLLQPIDVATFFDAHWERAPLHIARNRRGHFDDLLSLDEIDHLLAEQVFRADECKVAKEGEIISAASYLSEPRMPVMGRRIVDQVDAARLLQWFQQGATLVFAQLNQRCPALQRLKTQLERELQAAVLANAFLSNRDAQGFSAHYDSHDVIVLQIHGHKRWLLRGNPIALPLKTQAFGSVPAEAGPVREEIELQPGDLLYIPRGTFHEARTSDAVSLHLTLGVHPVQWAEYLGELLQRAAERDVVLRRSMPRDWATRSAADRVAEISARLALAAHDDHPDPCTLLSRRERDLHAPAKRLLQLVGGDA